MRLLWVQKIENRILMVKNNNRIFDRDIIPILIKYPDLKHLPSAENYFRLEGDVPIHDANGCLWDILTVRIEYDYTYPKGFADLYEIGGDIPKTESWHKSTSDKCCVCTTPEEQIQKQKSQKAYYFLEEYALPFLVNYVYKKQYGFYPKGDYEHYENGIIQWYQEQFGCCSIANIQRILLLILQDKKVLNLENECFCGLGRKFEDCHFDFCNDLRLIPKYHLLNDVKLLFKSEHLKWIPLNFYLRLV